jgi:hypothetical protein
MQIYKYVLIIQHQPILRLRKVVQGTHIRNCCLTLSFLNLIFYFVQKGLMLSFFLSFFLSFLVLYFLLPRLLYLITPACNETKLMHYLSSVYCIVHQVGLITRIFRDARSTKHKIDNTHWHTHTHTLGRTPLDQGSARHRDLCLTTHNTTRDTQPYHRRDSKPQSQQARSRRSPRLQESA